jgi:flagellin FlaB
MNRQKPNMKCTKCGYQWHTRSKLKMVTCPSCNQKIRNDANPRPRLLRQFLQQKRGIIGLEAAIVLIAFVIIAAAFSFMVVNQGLYATERGKTVIQEGLKQASTPLTIDGTTFVRTEPSGRSVDLIVIPVKAFGVKYVPAGRNQTVVVLRVGERAWANAYLGVLYMGESNGAAYNATSFTYDPTGKEFDEFVGFQFANQTTSGDPCDIYVNETYAAGHSKGLVTGVVLAIANSNGDEALDTGEKGFLLISLAHDAAASARAQINIEIRLETSATLSIEISVPASMPPNTYVPVT